MKRYYKYLIILFFSCSCSHSEKVKSSNIENTQLEFLRIISRDTTTIFSNNYRNAFVFEKPFINSKKPVVRNGKTEWLSQIQLISEYLNLKDTLFVYNQIISKDLSTTYLNKVGFKTINYDKLVHRSYIGDSIIEKKLVSQDSLDKVFSLVEKHKYIYLLKPIFNESLDLAYFQIDYEEFRGSSFIYRKKNNNWVLEKEVSSWMR